MYKGHVLLLHGVQYENIKNSVYLKEINNQNSMSGTCLADF